jgi:hypothetical protein
MAVFYSSLQLSVCDYLLILCYEDFSQEAAGTEEGGERHGPLLLFKIISGNRYIILSCSQRAGEIVSKI